MGASDDDQSSVYDDLESSPLIEEEGENKSVVELDQLASDSIALIIDGYVVTSPYNFFFTLLSNIFFHFLDVQ